MSTQKDTISRSELYNKVWTTPLIKLAIELGISDRALAKKCKRYRIPFPGIGYWNKLKAGHKLKQKPLPALDDDNDPIVMTIRTKPAEPPIRKEIEEAITFEKDTVNSIVVAPERELAHPMVIRISRWLLRKKSERGAVLSNRGWMDSVTASAQSIQRALRILDALLSSLEARGHRVTWADKDRVKVAVTVFDETFNIRIVEHIQHVYQQHYEDYRQRWDYVPTGYLRFEFDGEFARGKSSDTPKRKRLENHINEMLIRLFKAADMTKTRRIEEEEWRKRHDIEMQIWHEKRRQEELERTRIELITSATEKWSATKAIEGFIEDVKANMALYTLNEEQVKKFHEIINWANDYLSRNNSVQLIANMLSKFD